MRIGVFGKGGSGKSTTAVLLSGALRKAGHEVCLLDADSTNLGVHLALGIQSPPVPLLEYYGGMIFSGGLVTCPVDDPTPLPRSHVDLDELPKRYFARSPEGIVLLIAGKIGDLGVGAGCDGPIAKIARDVEIQRCGTPMLTLVDFKAGFEDSARGVLSNLDYALVVLDPTVTSIQLAANMKRMVEEMKSGKMPATRHLRNSDLVRLANEMYENASIKDVVFVMNRIASDKAEEHVVRALRDHGIEPMGALHEDSGISLAWLRGHPVGNARIARDVEGVKEALEAKLRIPAAL
jgi:CO dehydrogenase maturation factor